MSLSAKIILHTNDELIEGYVKDENEFFKWSIENLRSRGKKLYIVLPGQDATSAFITEHVEDIEQFFEYLFIDDLFFIMEFEAGDYADALGYLADLYEAKEPFDPKINNN